MTRHDVERLTARYQADPEFRSRVDATGSPQELVEFAVRHGFFVDIDDFSVTDDIDLADLDLDLPVDEQSSTVGLCTGAFFCHTLGRHRCTAGPSVCGD